MSGEHDEWCPANGCRCGGCPCAGPPLCGVAGMTVAEFLLARLAEDEARWAEVSPQRRDEYEIKRRIVAEDTSQVTRLLALPYAAHPDYREEWRV